MKVLPKAEIYRRMERFWKDPDKTLSIAMFAELCGLSVSLLKGIFQTRYLLMTEHSQICISRAIERMARGDVLMVQNKDRTRRLMYRQTPKPRLARDIKITFDGNGFGLAAGPRNKSDYSAPTLQEKLNGDKTRL